MNVECDVDFIQPVLIMGLWQFRSTVLLKASEKHGTGSTDVARIIWKVVSIILNRNLVLPVYSSADLRIVTRNVLLTSNS
jgi:riboflavin transporter FmnP